jgi:negative regulator of sigma E activity
MIRLLASILLGFVLASPAPALACGVCMSGLKESATRYGFYAMTGVLTVAGCGLLAALAVLVVRRYSAPSAAAQRLDAAHPL